ncbi:hypothetical protein Zmor_016212 [Zophobas morio]|uniref:Uncharacterized protein n=1 Tax=Zophobas morio TaxID=2755281 RepID=A0AA38IFR5_9CUCU|nr:hypothetical protein Zmor_016212 [Zophobas morio]
MLARPVLAEPHQQAPVPSSPLLRSRHQVRQYPSKNSLCELNKASRTCFLSRRFAIVIAASAASGTCHLLARTSDSLSGLPAIFASCSNSGVLDKRDVTQRGGRRPPALGAIENWMACAVAAFFDVPRTPPPSPRPQVSARRAAAGRAAPPDVHFSTVSFSFGWAGLMGAWAAGVDLLDVNTCRMDRNMCGALARSGGSRAKNGGGRDGNAGGGGGDAEESSEAAAGRGRCAG